MGLSALELGKSWAHGDEMLPLQDSPSLIRSKGALERIWQIVVPLDWCHNPPHLSAVNYGFRPSNHDFLAWGIYYSIF